MDLTKASFDTNMSSADYLASRPKDTMKLMSDIMAGVNPPDHPPVDHQNFSLSMVSHGRIEDAYCCVHFRRFEPNVMIYALSEDGDGMGDRTHFATFEDLLVRILQRWW